MSMQANPFGVTLNLEFDATAMRCRVRQGMVEADSKYHIMAPCLCRVDIPVLVNALCGSVGSVDQVLSCKGSHGKPLI